MIFIQIPVGPMQNFSYIIGDEKTSQAAIIDPAWSYDKIFGLLKQNGLQVKCIINTHSHFDHVQENSIWKKSAGAKIVAHKDASIEKDISVQDGDIIRIGEVEVNVIHTPGHTEDSICLLAQGKLITGDTLFVGECGRTDLRGGSPEKMYESLLNKILKFEDNVEVYPGHDYGKMPFSTIGYERLYNYTLKPRTKDEFIKFVMM